MKTKERIIQAAIQLFNARGTKSVSTNHIAEAAGMSPGNLYYHYKNKAEIIQDILSYMMDDLEGAGNPFDEQYSCIKQMVNCIERMLERQWTYRFIQTELLSLMDRDPLLRERIGNLNKYRLEQFNRLIRQMIEQDQMIDLTDETINFLARSSFVVTVFWHAHLRLCGEVNIPKEKLIDGKKQIILLLRPYLKNPELMEGTLY